MKAPTLLPVLGACVGLALVVGAPALAQGTVSASSAVASAPVSVFDIPQIMRGQLSALMLAKAGNSGAAIAALGALIARFPSVAALHYRLAALLVVNGRHGEAIESLARAVELGLPPGLLEREPAFDPIRDDPRYRALATAAQRNTPTPAAAATEIRPILVGDGVAPVSSANTVWDPRTNMLRSLFRFSAEGAPDSAVLDDQSRVAVRLNGWFRAGTAAGNHGDLYDNRDRRHSKLPPASFPQMGRVQYGKEAKAAGLDRGFNDVFLFNAATIGNASLANTDGPMWRSLPRGALTNPLQIAALFQQYISNHIYVYPEHRDHDPNNGDLIPANTPYMLISQGSSGSDQPVVQAVAAILAAFRPDTKSFLVKNGLIAPTVQWIFRLSQAGVNTPKNYLTGRAHPSVFDGKALNVLEMIERANQLEVADVPPMVNLIVGEESHGDIVTDTFVPVGGDRLFDTPSAIARIIRSTAYNKRLVVDASRTADPNGRPLTFRWSVLRGDADRITIRPLNDQGSVAEIIIPWHERQPIVWQPKITTDRVDIGVFASNGEHWSAPAFVSLLFPANEKRTYRADQQIAEVDYQDPGYRRRYVDPILFPIREWRDLYLYDDSGRLLGWKRVGQDGTSHFTRDGARVTKTDLLDRAVEAKRVRYQLRGRPDGKMEVVEVPTGTIVTYVYATDDDRIGVSAEGDGD